MMRWLLYACICGVSYTVSAKEWKNFKVYQNETHNQTLSPSDWLKKDRIRNSLVWRQANTYNLLHDLPKEYRSIQERKDFYKWLYVALNKQGYEIVWIKMAYFISKKMRLLETFPWVLFIRKKIVRYANEGSEVVFNNAFMELREIFISKKAMKESLALEWDQKMAYNEQYVWLDNLYKTIDSKSLKTIEHMAKGKFLYGLAVPKAIRFKGQISNSKTRYHYAIGPLRSYCEVLCKE